MINLKVRLIGFAHDAMEATVRVPGARMAPVMRTWACCQTDREKTGTKMEMTLVNVVGKENIARYPIGLQDS
jgi:hypothetical protein